MVLLFEVSFAARVRKPSLEKSAKKKKTFAPNSVHQLVERIHTRSCVQKLLQEFLVVYELTGEDNHKALNKAAISKFGRERGPNNGIYKGEWVPRVNQTITSDDEINATMYPECPVGANLLRCARTLPPAMWLLQLWTVGDVHELHRKKWPCPWCAQPAPHADYNYTLSASKKDFFRHAVKKLGFSKTAAAKHCKKQQKLRDQALVQQCILSKAEEIPKSKEVKAILDEYYDADTQWLLKHTVAHGSIRKRQRKAGLVTPKKQAKLKKMVATMGADVHNWEKACNKMTPSHWSKEWFSRLKLEYQSCNKSEDGVCQENGDTYCPEGSACDCRRAATPQRAAVAAGVGFGVSNLIFAGIGGFVAVTAAAPVGMLAFINQFVLGAGVMVASPASPDWPIALALGLTFSRTLTSQCMCFHQKCVYDQALDVCRMTPGKRMSSSTNPVHYLPPNGLKCTSILPEKCKMDPCSLTDMSSPPPKEGTFGAGLFGNVGRAGRSIYNCAGTKGTMDTLLSTLPELPSSTGDKVPNSAKARADMLLHHPSLSAARSEKDFTAPVFAPEDLDDDEDEEMDESADGDHDESNADENGDQNQMSKTKLMEPAKTILIGSWPQEALEE